MLRIFSLLGFAFVCTNAFAIDVPFGSDALPYNAGKATLIARAESVELVSKVALDGSVERSLYRCVVGRPLKGGQASDTTALFVVVPKPFDFPNPSDYVGKLLFLVRVDNPVELKDFSNAPNANANDVYRLVAGRNSAIDVTDKQRFAAIESYLRMVKNEKRTDTERTNLSLEQASWCKEFLTSSDPYLQRSMILELHRYSTDKGAVNLLGEILVQPNIKPELKRDAVNALQNSGLQEAVMPLKTLAEDAKLLPAIRSHAIKAVGNLPGGIDELRKWRDSSSDKLLQQSSAVEFERASSRNR